MFIAIREFLYEKSRFFLITTVIFLISFLVYFLTGLAYGLASKVSNAAVNWKADAIVYTTEANDNLFMSTMNEENLKDVHAQDKTYLASSMAIVKGHAKEENVNTVLFAIDPHSFIAPTITEGTMFTSDNQAVVDESLKEDGFTLGSTITFGGKFDGELTIVGFTDHANFQVQPVIYTSLDFYQTFRKAGQPGLPANHPPINPTVEPVAPPRLTNQNAGVPAAPVASQSGAVAAPGGQRAVVADASQGGQSTAGEAASPATQATALAADSPTINAIIVKAADHDLANITLTNDKLSVVSINDFISKLPGYSAQNMTFMLMIGVLIFIAAMVIGIFVYVLTIQRASMFGVMKAQGITNWYISKYVVDKTMLVAIIGVVLGLLATLGTAIAIPAAVPFQINVGFFGLITVLFIVFSLLGGLFSVRAVTKIDPLEALRQ